MVNISITLEGSTDELAPLLRYIANMGIYASVKEVQEEVGPSVEGSEEMYWTEVKVRQIWRGITIQCQDVLKKIAKYEDGISWWELLNSLNLKPNQIGGRLSSLGHQLRISGYKMLPEPLIWTADKKYKMDSVWRRTIQKIQKEAEAIQPDN